MVNVILNSKFDASVFFLFFFVRFIPSRRSNIEWIASADEVTHPRHIRPIIAAKFLLIRLEIFRLNKS